jgi:hypothetical protein
VSTGRLTAASALRGWVSDVHARAAAFDIIRDPFGFVVGIIMDAVGW